MDRTGAVFPQGCIMRLRAIALVQSKAVLRVKCILLLHKAVPRDLCENGSGGNVCAQTVGPHDGFDGDCTKFRLPLSVPKRQVGPQLARKVACRMLISSISCSLAKAMP